MIENIMVWNVLYEKEFNLETFNDNRIFSLLMDFGYFLGGGGGGGKVYFWNHGFLFLDL